MGKFVENITLVSGLFYIGRDKWKYSGFQNGDRYKSWVENLLSLKAKIIFFADPTYVDYVKEVRRKYDPDFNLTEIREVDLESLSFYKKYINDISVKMFSPTFNNKVFFKETADMSYPLYHIVNYSKIELLKNAKEIDKFNTDFYFWVDAGGLRDDFKKYEHNIWPTIKKGTLSPDKVTHFTHHLNFNFDNGKDDHFRSQNRYIQGTAWIVPSALINLYYELIDTEVKESLSKFIVGSDEKIYDSLYLKNKDRINLIKAGWFKFYDILNTRNKKVFLDLGSHNHEGFSQLNEMYEFDESWEIHSFEPNPIFSESEILNDLRSRYNFLFYDKAIWVENTTLKFNRYGHSGESEGSTLDTTKGDTDYKDYVDSIPVQAIDIHEFLSTFKEYQEIHIKMDIEHSEYTVIPYLLEKGIPPNLVKLFIEFHNLNDSRNVKIKNDLIDKLEKAGVEVVEWH